MYTADTTESEAAQFGLKAEHLDAPVFDVWPDNWQAACLFVFMGTQWRVGFSGKTGIDYNVLFHKMDRLGLEPGRYEELEDEVRVMENAVLEKMQQDATRNG